MDRRSFLQSMPAAIALGSAPIAALAAKNDPQDRIDAAMKEIEAALAEMHPDWRLQSKSDVLRPSICQPLGGFIKGEPYRHTVLISAGREHYGPQDIRWFAVDLPDLPLTTTN